MADMPKSPVPVPGEYSLDQLYDKLLKADARGERDLVAEIQGRISTAQAAAMEADPSAQHVFEETGVNPHEVSRPTQLLAQGIEGVAGIPGDTAQNLANLGLAAGGFLGHEMLGLPAGEMPEPIFGMPGTSEWMRAGTPAASGATPQNLGEEIGVNLPAALMGRPQGVPAILRDLAATVLPTTAAHAAAGGGPAGSTSAALGTQVLQEIARRKTPGVLRSAVGGGPQVAQEVANQRAAGITQPAPSTLVNKMPLKVAEQATSAIPVSDMMAAERAKRRVPGVQAKVDELVQQHVPQDLHGTAMGVPDQEAAGLQVTKGAESYIRHVKEVSKQLYDSMTYPTIQAGPKAGQKSPNHIPVQTPMTLTETDKLITAFKDEYRNDPGVMKYLDGLEEEIKNASKVRAGPQLLGPDAKPIHSGAPPQANTVPFSLADRRRREAGRKYGEGKQMLVSEVPERIYKGIEGALLTDIENSLPQGSRQRSIWQRARRYTELVHRQRIDPLQKAYGQRAEPEKALRAALSGTRTGASHFRYIMKALDAEQPRAAGMVRAHIIDGLGRKKPGGVGVRERGEFSFDTFMTNWRNLHPDARAVLFKDPKTEAAMDNIARTIEKYRTSGEFLYNPAGTAKRETWAIAATTFLSGVAGGVGGALTGHPAVAAAGFGTAASVASGITGGALLSKAMNSERFIRWLGESPKVPPERRGQFLTQLQLIAQQEQDAQARQGMQALHDFLAREERKGRDEKARVSSKYGKTGPP